MTQIRQLVLSIGAKSKPIWDVEVKEVKPMPTVVSLVQSNHFPITTIPTSRVGCLLFFSSPLSFFLSSLFSSFSLLGRLNPNFRKKIGNQPGWQLTGLTGFRDRLFKA